MIKKLLASIVILIVLIGTLIVTYNYSLQPASDQEIGTEFVINKGDYGKVVAKNLKEHNLIQSELTFNIYVKLNKVSGLQAGKYLLSPSMSVEEIVQKFTTGDVMVNEAKLAIPEGFTIEEIARRVESDFGIKYDDIIAKWNDKAYLETLIDEYWFLTDDILTDGIRYPLEGYFYPATYTFNKDDVNLDVITKYMLDTTKNNLEPLKSKIEQSGYSIHEIMTLASIIELETLNDPEKPLVASVFENRLAVNQPLQSDPTVLYALGYHKDRVLYEDLKIDSPYNTYKVSGVPIGPMASPSKESVEAMLEPEKTDYYYFISDKTGKFHFAKDYATHLDLVEKYLR